MPVTRSATLRVAHSRSCPNATRSALNSTGKGSGCTCKPAYFTFHRDSGANPVYGPRVRERQTAERALRKLLVTIDEGRVGVGRRTKQIRVLAANPYGYAQSSSSIVSPVSALRSCPRRGTRATGDAISLAWRPSRCNVEGCADHTPGAPRPPPRRIAISRGAPPPSQDRGPSRLRPAGSPTAHTRR
jgi:hypothetical protein